MSTESPPESVSCPNCGNDVTSGENMPRWCPQCGARLHGISTVKALWEKAVAALVGCVLTTFGMLGSCGLVIYGVWRFSQTHVGALVLNALIVFVAVASVIGTIRRRLRKP